LREPVGRGVVARTRRRVPRTWAAAARFGPDASRPGPWDASDALGRCGGSGRMPPGPGRGTPGTRWAAARFGQRTIWPPGEAGLSVSTHLVDHQGPSGSPGEPLSWIPTWRPVRWRIGRTTGRRRTAGGRRRTAGGGRQASGSGQRAEARRTTSS